MSLTAYVVVSLTFGAIAAAIGSRKNFNAVHCFLLGAVFPALGLVMVIAQRPNLPPAPPGMLALRCPSCNAVQNIAIAESSFECWQCKCVNDSAAASQVAGQWGLDGPEDTRAWLNRIKNQRRER